MRFQWNAMQMQFSNNYASLSYSKQTKAGVFKRLIFKDRTICSLRENLVLKRTGTYIFLYKGLTLLCEKNSKHDIIKSKCCKFK